MANEVSEAWNMICPQCKGDDHIQVLIEAWAKLSANGTDADSDHLWDESSDAQCTDCGYVGKVWDFNEAWEDAQEDAHVCGDECRSNGCKGD